MNLDKTITKELKKWLKKEGIEYFKEIKEKHNTIATACWMDDGVPHLVHFREGMQVRNFMRTLKKCKTWTDIDFDNKWGLYIEGAIQ